MAHNLHSFVFSNIDYFTRKKHCCQPFRNKKSFIFPSDSIFSANFIKHNPILKSFLVHEILHSIHYTLKVKTASVPQPSLPKNPNSNIIWIGFQKDGNKINNNPIPNKPKVKYKGFPCRLSLRKIYDRQNNPIIYTK